jgi:ribonucleoside-diphosphate reductase alpha chain
MEWSVMVASVIKRDGTLVDFDRAKIEAAIKKALAATNALDAGQVTQIYGITESVIAGLDAELNSGPVNVETIQDAVVSTLIFMGYGKTADAYQSYRQAQSDKRHQAGLDVLDINVRQGDSLEPLDIKRLRATLDAACAGYADVSAEVLWQSVQRSLYEGMGADAIPQLCIKAAAAMIAEEPNYSYVAATLLNEVVELKAYENIGCYVSYDFDPRQLMSAASHFVNYVNAAIEIGRLDPRLDDFDLYLLGNALRPERNRQFTYLGLQTLADRYLLKTPSQGIIETPQELFMRVAMGLALNEDDKNDRAIEFYHAISAFDLMPSTPTLFNSGTVRPQLSSCYLTTVPDDLSGIYQALHDNAMLSKFAGGLGNDWSRVRAMGSHINGTNGKSQGVVPFMAVANASVVAVNQGGLRKGAAAAYLENWHLDIEEFLELRKNTGDERRRTHDMNTACWVSDLFMRRVQEGLNWTLFSPSDAPDLHELYGESFVEAYTRYEALAEQGLIPHKKVLAVTLWRKMLTMLFETGHPWLTFKDPCNLRSPQQHVGVVHSSNLCTEVTLNTSDDEVAVCNLLSINLAAHVDENGIDSDKLGRTVRTAMRMLDNVIDINYYPVPQARKSNLRHRPVGLGLMGFQDALYKLGLAYASDAAVEFADTSMEFISFCAILASTELAEERGHYESFQGSLWQQGKLPIDTVSAVSDVNRQKAMYWGELRELVSTRGMRNSNCMAIAPTATISLIAGVTQSIEPTYQNLFVKSNLSGDFTVTNTYLVADLKRAGLWDAKMRSDLRSSGGSVQGIDRIPAELKARFKTAFEIEPEWLIEAASRRQKWIDQAQSLNLYMKEPSGKKLSDMYMLAWKRGLKTTYYLHSQAASAVAQHTASAASSAAAEPPLVCSLETGCEACQ